MTSSNAFVSSLMPNRASSRCGTSIERDGTRARNLRKGNSAIAVMVRLGLMSPMPLNELILIAPEEYTKRGYVFEESGETCIIFVLPGYQWHEAKKPPVPQSGPQVQYWSVATVEQASAFADAFPAVQSTEPLPPNPLPEG